MIRFVLLALTLVAVNAQNSQFQKIYDGSVVYPPTKHEDVRGAIVDVSPLYAVITDTYNVA
jgi:hypothetical protein